MRYLQVCESIGRVDNICTDTTGLLTMNKMTVTKLFLLENTIENPAKDSMSEEVAQILSHAICVNSTAKPIFEDGKVEQIGNKTECALL